MRIAVRRTGGFAGITTRWSVDVGPPELAEVWMPLIESCPWDDVPGSENQPDRFMYSIRAGEREATLPESGVTGPWRTLVDRTRDAARENSQGEPAGDAGTVPEDEVLEPDRPATDPSRHATEPERRLFPRRPKAPETDRP